MFYNIFYEVKEYASMYPDKLQELTITELDKIFKEKQECRENSQTGNDIFENKFN